MKTPFLSAIATLLVATFAATALAETADACQDRPAAHQGYAEHMWNYITHDRIDYRNWNSGASDISLGVGPTTSGEGKTYLNAIAAGNKEDLPQGSIVVHEHLDDAGNVSAISVWKRQEEGYSDRNQDWYWAHYLVDGTVASTIGDSSPCKKPGFVTRVVDGRLWVFRCGTNELADFLASGELAKHVIRPKAGPLGMTLKAPDSETMALFLASKPGFAILLDDGRIWVFREGSEDFAKMQAGIELAKHVIRPKAGPLGMTIKAPDSETIAAYLASKPGFAVIVDDGRLWVFEEGSEDLAKMQAGGELAKHVIRPKAGPAGMTLKAPDSETIARYMAAAPGFVVEVEDGRLWVFRNGSEELKKYRESGELAKHVIRPKAGPLGMTVKAPDAETIDAYLASVR